PATTRGAATACTPTTATPASWRSTASSPPATRTSSPSSRWPTTGPRRCCCSRPTSPTTSRWWARRTSPASSTRSSATARRCARRSSSTPTHPSASASSPPSGRGCATGWPSTARSPGSPTARRSRPSPTCRPPPGALSVERRVRREVGEHRHLAALAAEHGPPHLLGVGGEHVVTDRGHDEPRPLGQLALELAGAPARVAGEEPDAGDGVPQVARVAVQVDGADLPDHPVPSRQLGVAAGPAGEREHAVRLDGAAPVD